MHKDLLSALVEAGKLNQHAISVILREDRFKDLSAPEALVVSGLMEEEPLARFMADLYEIPFVALETRALMPELLSLIPREVAESAHIVPLERHGDVLTVAMADPFDVLAEDVVRMHTGCRLKKVVATKKEIRRALKGRQADISRMLTGFTGKLDADVELVAQAEEEEADGEEHREAMAPIIKLVNALVLEAIVLKASDIHVEPLETHVRVRYRVDGVLRKMGELPVSIRSSLISRLKLISGMDISERRRPQDGRTRAIHGEQAVDLRVSSLPGYYGEKIVLRILDKSIGLLSLDGLGMLTNDLATYKRMLMSPQGTILCTGPTGSGKTSTLYASLNARNVITDNIITVEDPIEFQLPGITQVQVNPKAALTFASALRSILRQDPDVIMVGEIRDLETAEIAFQAAQTGHFVLSTVHTNSAPATITRLAHMGVVPYLVGSSILGVVAQRLVRRICPHCCVETHPPQDLLDYLKQATELGMPEQFMTGKGCEACGSTGYSGRVGLYEIMPMSEKLQSLVYENASQVRISRAAREEGLSTLLDDGLKKVATGLTSLDEVLRVVTVAPRSAEDKE